MNQTLLSDVCQITMGQAPAGSSYNFDKEGLPLIAGAGDFGVESPNPSKFTTSPTRTSKVGDIILCIRATIGDRNWSDKPYCLGRGVAGLTPVPNRLDSHYLWHLLATKKPELLREAKGSTFKQIGKDTIQSLKIPLPPLEEQKRIAAILDKADAIRKKRKQTIELSEQFLRSAFLDIFGDPITNPKEWTIATLGELVEIKGGGTPSRKVPEYWVGPIPWATVKDFKSDHLTKTQESISKEGVSNSAANIIPEGNIIVPTRMAVGKIAINDIGLAINQDLKALFILNQNIICRDYLYSAIKFQAAILEKNAKGATVKGITLDVLRNLRILLPPLSLQHKYVSISKELKQNLFKKQLSLKESDSLFSALTQHAFQGEL